MKSEIKDSKSTVSKKDVDSRALRNMNSFEWPKYLSSKYQKRLP